MTKPVEEHRAKAASIAFAAIDNDPGAFTNENRTGTLAGLIADNNLKDRPNAHRGATAVIDLTPERLVTILKGTVTSHARTKSDKASQVFVKGSQAVSQAYLESIGFQAPAARTGANENGVEDAVRGTISSAAGPM